MKHNIYIAALLAGMLALVGCGGGNSSTPATETVVEGTTPSTSTGTEGSENGTPKTYTQEELDDEVNSKSEAARKASCTGDGLTYDESSKMCMVDTSAADAEKVRADAIHYHNEFSLSTFSLDFAEIPSTIADDKQDSHKLAAVEGSTLTIAPSSDPAHVAFSSFQDGAGIEGLTAGSSTLGRGVTEKTYPGKLDGIDGDFVCTGTAGTTVCRVQDRSGGGFVLNNADAGVTWTFEPDDAEDKRMHEVEFGWWLAGTDAGRTVNFYADSDGLMDVSNLDPVTDNVEAVYNGKAKGVYAITNAGGSTPNEFDSFTADAKLTATFGPSNADTLKGEISNFILDGDTDATGWKVMLKETTLATSSGTVGLIAASIDANDATPLDNRSTQWDIGSTTSDPVNDAWQATFHGTAETSTAEAPEAVTGAFRATHKTTGAMAGSFGATR